MPSKDNSNSRRGTSSNKKNAFCSFCRKSYRDVGPLVEGPGDVYICGECIELCQSILEQEQRRRGSTKKLFNEIPTPRNIVSQLDQYVIGQAAAKRVLAVAVHNHKLHSLEKRGCMSVQNTSFERHRQSPQPPQRR